MSNFLENGAVLPSGLLGHNPEVEMAGFNKSYRNYALKVGVILHSYDVKDNINISKLTTEYDVMVVEQHEDKGATTIVYKNCMSAAGLGSVADYFEANLRKLEKNTSGKDSINLNNQNGATVLMLCLDGVGDKAIIIGAISHPDRKTNLQTTAPYLEGEYNGANIMVDNDGAATFTFKGATDNDGNPTDTTQGTTTISVEKDGSYQVGHDSITERLDRNGQYTVTSKDVATFNTDTNFAVNATEDIVLTAKGDLNGSMNNLVLNAQGSATISCQKLSISASSDISMSGSQITMQGQSIVQIKAPQVSVQGQVALGSSGGMPVLLLSSMMLGYAGPIPVISLAISGYSTMVTAS